MIHKSGAFVTGPSADVCLVFKCPAFCGILPCRAIPELLPEEARSSFSRGFTAASTSWPGVVDLCGSVWGFGRPIVALGELIA